MYRQIQDTSLTFELASLHFEMMKGKGFVEDSRPDFQIANLFAGEFAEAFEAIRKNRRLDSDDYGMIRAMLATGEHQDEWGYKTLITPYLDTIEFELADLWLRVAHYLFESARDEFRTKEDLIYSLQTGIYAEEWDKNPHRAYNDIFKACIKCNVFEIVGGILWLSLQYGPADLPLIITAKMEYNKFRHYKHGKAF